MHATGLSIVATSYSDVKTALDRHRAQGCWAGYVEIFPYTQ
jgi:hypothetical protein